AVLAASAIMFPRMLIIAAVVKPEVAMKIAPAFAVATLLTAGGAGWFAWRSRNTEPDSSTNELQTRNPLDLWFALKFGLLLTVIMVVTRAAESVLGNRGLFTFAGISGLADVDAITLSVSL